MNHARDPRHHEPMALVVLASTTVRALGSVEPSTFFFARGMDPLREDVHMCDARG
jgi:hypothetical protein